MFAGTPAPALPSLERLLASRHEVVAVLTRPDARAGRGRASASSPVAALAREHGVAVLTPARPNEPEFVRELAQLDVDCCAVVAYGALLKPELLAVPRLGWGICTSRCCRPGVVPRRYKLRSRLEMRSRALQHFSLSPHWTVDPCTGW
ncbi:Probable methionyl-tRNA formyltransferase [Mycobacteroides abscessus]|nr:Probable methionyl-tRNA formyltransferase [Mycobacteroides abscessus]